MRSGIRELVVAVALAVAVAVLLGWWTGSAVLYTFGGRAATTPVSAVGLLLVVLGTVANGRLGTVATAGAAVLAVLALLFPDGLLSLQQVLFPSTGAVSSPGTSAVLLLLAASLRLRRQLPDTAYGLALAAGSIAVVAAVGPALGLDWAAVAGASQPAFGMARPTTLLTLLAVVSMVLAPQRDHWAVAGVHRGTVPMLVASVLTPWLVVVVAGDRGRAGYLAGVLGAALVAVLLSRSLGGTTQRRDAVRAMVESAPDPMLVVDDVGLVLTVNDLFAALVGADAAALEGSAVDALVPSDLRAAHAGLRAAYAADPVARPMGRTGEIELLRTDGELVPVDIALAPLTLGGVQLFLATVRDVSAQREAVAELRRVDRLRQLLLQAVSHELRTPLAVLIGSTAILRQGHEDMAPDQIDDLLDRAARSARHLDGMVHDLLDVQRLGTGRGEPLEVVVPTRVEAAVREAVEEVGLDEVTLTVEDDVPAVVTDEDLLVRVLVNLLANAQKYAPGPVDVRVTAAAAGLELRVEDHGDGLPPSLHDRVFEPFDRGGRDDGLPGMGIGLSLVAGLAEHSGGRAWVTDRADGAHGASFRLWLPAAEEGRR